MKKSYLLFISIVAALGGFLFGYDWVVIGGAKPFYELYFDIQNSAWLQGLAMTTALLGCIVGVTVSGKFCDKVGRKKMLFASAILFAVCAFGTGLANSFFMFNFFRFMGGVGIGIASNISPMYIAETAPASVRGKFVSFYQLAIVLGILGAQLFNWQIADPIAKGATNTEILASWNGQYAWRYMFYAQALPALAFTAMLFFIPESPKWLFSKQQQNKAYEILAKIGGADYAQAEIAEIKSTKPNNETNGGIRQLLKSDVRSVIILGIVLAIFQQWCGINVIFNYAQEIFNSAGFEVSEMLFTIVITGAINVIFTFVGMFTVDLLGRRKLLLFGSAGLFVIYALMGLSYFFALSGIYTLILVLSAIACYATTLAPVVWVVLSEIFPAKVRGVAMATATFALWVACAILTYTFPLLNKGLGAAGTFWLYGLICIAGYIFIKKNLPETKGKSLEQIEKELVR